MTTSGSLNLRYNITSKLAVSGLVSYSYDHNKSEDVIGKDTYTAFTDRLYFDRTNENWTPYGSIRPPLPVIVMMLGLRCLTWIHSGISIQFRY